MITRGVQLDPIPNPPGQRSLRIGGLDAATVGSGSLRPKLETS